MTISHDADDLARRMRVIDAVLGGGQVRTIALLGEGSDHVAYEVNGTFIARLSTHPGDAVAAIEREVQVLGLVRPVSPIPVPEVAPTTPTQGVLVLRKLPGTSLFDEPCKNPDVLVDQLEALAVQPARRSRGPARRRGAGRVPARLVPVRCRRRPGEDRRGAPAGLDREVRDLLTVERSAIEQLDGVVLGALAELHEALERQLLT